MKQVEERGAGYGFTSPSAVLQEEDYISILFMLTHTDMSKTQIAKELGVSKHIVTSISLRQSHQHLKLDYPEEYKILEDKFGSHSTTRIHEKQVTKTYKG